MPRLKQAVPSYRHHKPSGQAVVTLNGRDHYLGPWGTKTSSDAYDRLIGEWQANGRCLPTEAGSELSVAELMVAYLRFASEYYRKNAINC
jgi:hypothetical protein